MSGGICNGSPCPVGPRLARPLVAELAGQNPPYERQLATPPAARGVGLQSCPSKAAGAEHQRRGLCLAFLLTPGG